MRNAGRHKERDTKLRLRFEMHVRGQTTIVRGHATLARLSEAVRGVSVHSLGHTSDSLGYAPRELAHPGYRWTVVDFSGTLSQTPIPIIIMPCNLDFVVNRTVDFSWVVAQKDYCP